MKAISQPIRNSRQLLQHILQTCPCDVFMVSDPLQWLIRRQRHLPPVLKKHLRRTQMGDQKRNVTTVGMAITFTPKFAKKLHTSRRVILVKKDPNKISQSIYILLHEMSHHHCKSTKCPCKRKATRELHADKKAIGVLVSTTDWPVRLRRRVAEYITTNIINCILTAEKDDPYYKAAKKLVKTKEWEFLCKI